jgi:inhibitor of KinA
MADSLHYSIARLSERAVIVQFEPTISPENLKHILSFKASLEKNPFDGFLESVPGYSSLTIYFDAFRVNEARLPGRSPIDKVATFLKRLTVDDETVIDSRLHTIPVCYDSKFGLDLPELEKKFKLRKEEIIAMHSGIEYTVYLIGFTPGFPYLGILPEPLECKRKDNPRKRVEAGSVGIAGRQTGIYPFDTPGGWQIIGRTPVRLFSADLEIPCLLEPGDRVKFEPISLKEFQSLS